VNIARYLETEAFHWKKTFKQIGPPSFRAAEFLLKIYGCQRKAIIGWDQDDPVFVVEFWVDPLSPAFELLTEYQYTGRIKLKANVDLGDFELRSSESYLNLIDRYRAAAIRLNENNWPYQIAIQHSNSWYFSRIRRDWTDWTLSTQGHFKEFRKYHVHYQGLCQMRFNRRQLKRAQSREKGNNIWLRQGRRMPGEWVE